jgi:hypothetical protein
MRPAGFSIASPPSSIAVPGEGVCQLKGRRFGNETLPHGVRFLLAVHDEHENEMQDLRTVLQFFIYLFYL